MVALNFQTADTAIALNTAMFEQFGNSGYALRPRVMWDTAHPFYGKFNPWNRELTGISAVHLTFTVSRSLFD